MTEFNNKEEFIKLVNKYLHGKASPREIDFLEKYYQYFDKEKENGVVDQVTINEKEILEKELLTDIWKKTEKISPVISFYKRSWFRMAAAAILILTATGTFLLLNKTNNKQPVANNQQPVINDIAPGGNKAVLTLADGSQIILDSAANGNLTSQGNVKVIKLDNGQLAYTASGTTTEVFYNTVSTPRGGQYNLTLADGSRVWLNAASSLRYPASFSGNERKVELTGEGYFEVAKNASMPFKVNVAGKSEVEVLGTHFNINSYADESTINTTLLEGKVKVTPVANSQLNTQNSQLLSPGQQAQLNTNGQISIDKNANVEEVIAWKNGKFIFESADIKSIMRQLERWYDVEVSFENNITDEQFIGIISRDVKISHVLTMFEKSGVVKFEIDGKKVLVK